MTVLDWDHRVVVIGEVGQAHDGSLGTAHAFIDAIAGAGADAVKFQTHIAAAESRTDEPWRVRFSYADGSRYAYWKRMEFTAQAWVGLRRHAEDRGLAFLSSPFSLEAVDLLRRVGVAAWKVASGEVANPLLLDAVAQTGAPVLLSSGMSGWAELDGAVERLRGAGAGPLAVLQCTSAYPVTPERLGLNVLGEIRERYGCATGLSDHSGTIFPSLAAVALGGRVIEVHVTLSREMFGPDVAASVTSSELRLLVDGVRYVGAALAAPVDKNEVAAELAPMRALFGRSLVARRALPAGHVLAASDLTAKKPGGAIPPARLESLIGRRLRRALRPDEPLHDEDIEPAGPAQLSR
ncbi:MAG: N-acetylneuraminate synthase family protein [Pseudonocardiaceae bacterium]